MKSTVYLSRGAELTDIYRKLTDCLFRGAELTEIYRKLTVYVFRGAELTDISVLRKLTNVEVLSLR